MKLHKGSLEQNQIISQATKIGEDPLKTSTARR